MLDTDLNGESEDRRPQVSSDSGAGEDALGELWVQLREAIRKRVQPEQFETWFRRAALTRVDGEIVVIAVQNSFARDWLASYYSEGTEQAIQAVLGQRRRVEFHVDPELSLRERPREAHAPESRNGGHMPSATGHTNGGGMVRGAGPMVGRDAGSGGLPPAHPCGDEGHGKGSLPQSQSGSLANMDGPAPTQPSKQAAQSLPSPFAPSPFSTPGESSGASSSSDLDQRRTPGGLMWNSDVVLHPKYTFDNFVVGPCNRFAHAAAMGAGESPGKSYNPFFLHGSVGLGKTHLLQSICFSILDRWPNTRILYLSCETFVNHFINALEDGATQTFRHKYRNVDVLVVDDIHLLANKERTQEEFFHTFNALYNAGKQIVLSSDSPPKEIPTLQDRLVSRFKWGMVTEIEPPCYETRVALIKRKSRERGVEITDDVAGQVAERMETNVRELEGAVTKLVGFSRLTGRPIDTQLAREALSDVFEVRTGQPSMDDIIEVITKHFSVKLPDLQSKRRTASIAFPRQVAMYLARKITRHSLEEVGGFFGGRDHSTVVYAVDKIARLITEEEQTRTMVDGFFEQLRAGRH